MSGIHLVTPVVRVLRIAVVATFFGIGDAVAVAVGSCQRTRWVSGYFRTEFGAVVAVRTRIGWVGTVVTLFEVGLAVAVTVFCAERIGRIGGQQGADIYVVAVYLITTIVRVLRIAAVVAFVAIADTVAVTVGSCQSGVGSYGCAELSRVVRIATGVGRVGAVVALFEVGLAVAVAVFCTECIGSIRSQQGADIYVAGKYLLTSVVRIGRVTAVVAFLLVGHTVAIAIGASE